MNNKNLFVRLLVMSMATVFILFTSGCKKDDKNEKDQDTGSAVDHAFAEATYDDVNTISDQAAITGALWTYKSGGMENTLLSNCATITHDTTITPKLLIIDFGTSNCLCSDGRYRRGRILVTYSGAYRDSSSSHTISFNNYYVNDYKVDGSKTVTNGGHNSNGNLFFNISVNGLITAPGGQTLDWNSTRVREWTQGESTIFDWTDDVYQITGTASGNSFLGKNFTASISSPLVVALNCRWIKDGDLEFTPAGLYTRYIDYGHIGGNCDRLAKVTINGYDFIIELR